MSEIKNKPFSPVSRADAEESNDEEMASGGGSGRSSSALELCKKFKRIKYEIDVQNYKISKLQRELKANKLPRSQAERMEAVLASEMCKLGEMIQQAMKEQRLNKEENCDWGTVSLIDPPTRDSDSVLLLPPKTPSDISNVSGFDEYAFTEMLLSDNEALEQDRSRLQETILEREHSNCCMQRKISVLREQMQKLIRSNQKIASKMSDGATRDHEKIATDLEHCSNMANTITTNLHRMEAYVKELRSEFDCLKDGKSKPMPDIVKSVVVAAPSEVDAHDEKIKELQSQYAALLQSYCAKEKEHEETTDRLKKCLKANSSAGGACEQAEIELLRGEAEKLISEIDDYKLMIKEQQLQIDLYREKFIKAQEKVEKQKIQLKKHESSKHDIEGQINEEMKKIKAKFEEKLAELCPYPQKYEESQKRLEESLLKIEALEKEFCEVSSALVSAKCELKELNDRRPKESQLEKYEKMRSEIERLKKSEVTMKRTKECLEEKLCNMKTELVELRKDSSKIIATTKCCAEKNRQILHDQINCLEMELAQCRASASLSLAEKEEMIKSLRKELQVLCNHFNDCQGQIGQLKEQIVNLTESRYNESHNTDCYQIFSNK